MLMSVEITNAAGNTLQLPLTDSSAGYSVRDIEGLDPVKATLTSSTMAQMDGAQPQSASRGTRNITMIVGLEPDYVTNTVDSLRQDLYAYFLTASIVQIVFIKDDITVYTQGQVESCENSMFSTDPAVNISIICYDPDFLVAETGTWSAGTTTDTSVIPISYDGTANAGITFSLSVNRTLNGFTIYNIHPDNTIQIFDVQGAFILDDVIDIVTIPGSKSVTLTRNGIVSSILYDVDPASTWITFTNGINSFRVYATGAGVPYLVEWQPKYGAV